MTVINPNIRTLLLLSLLIGALVLAILSFGPQGIVPATGMSSPMEASFKNLNLRASALPVTHFNGGDVAPGVSVATKAIDILVKFDLSTKVDFIYLIMFGNSVPCPFREPMSSIG